MSVLTRPAVSIVQKGVAFGRFAYSLAQSHISGGSPAEIAEQFRDT
jgi:hypothetical protein